MSAAFPIDLSAYQKVTLDPANKTLTDAQRSALKANIQLSRDAIVFFTATLRYCPRSDDS
jgi:hypothetical protein